LEDKELPDLQALFAEVQPTTDPPLGSATARSPRLRFRDLRALWLESSGDGRKRRDRETPEAQLTLIWAQETPDRAGRGFLRLGRRAARLPLGQTRNAGASRCAGGRASAYLT